jgi:hypothetical protein
LRIRSSLISLNIAPFQIVAEGNCWVKAKTNICRALSPGDIIIFPHGDAHILGFGMATLPGVSVRSSILSTAASSLAIVVHENKGRYIII